MLISVLVDTYNHERFLRDALDSVLGQEGLGAHDVEVIVVDDGSTDSTPELVRAYADRVRYVRKSNGGQASAFNAGIPLCNGELIALLDGDDWWHPKKLATVIDQFTRDPSLVAVGHGYFEVDQVAERTYEVRPDRLLDLHLGSKLKASELARNMAYLGTSRLTARRDVLVSLLDVPVELVFEADEYLFTLLPACGRVAVLAECLTFYRIHGGNLYHSSRTGRAPAAMESRLKAKARIFACLSATIRSALSGRGLAPEIVDTVLAPLEVAATRLRLQADGGGRWENFLSEARAARLAKPRLSLKDVLILAVSLSLTILLSPKRFFSIRSSYSGSAMRRVLRGAVSGDER